MQVNFDKIVCPLVQSPRRSKWCFHWHEDTLSELAKDSELFGLSSYKNWLRVVRMMSRIMFMMRIMAFIKYLNMS